MACELCGGGDTWIKTCLTPEGSRLLVCDPCHGEHERELTIVPGDTMVTACCDACGVCSNPRIFSGLRLGGRKGAYSGLCTACAGEAIERREGPRGGGGGSRRFDPRLVVRDPDVLTKTCIRALLEDAPRRQVLGPREACFSATTTIEAPLKAPQWCGRRTREWIGRIPVVLERCKVPPAPPANGWGRSKAELTARLPG